MIYGTAGVAVGETESAVAENPREVFNESKADIISCAAESLKLI
jgi:hypothetical protein